MAYNNNSHSNGGYSNNNKKNKNSYNNHKNNTVSYVGAPYNFIPINNKVIKKTKDDMAVHDIINDEIMSGEISYNLIAQTPIFINDGSGNFFKNEYGQYAIPGSSMRGLVRSNAQILGFASLDQDIDDYSLMFREITAGKDKKTYGNILGAGTIQVNGNSVSVLNKVKAGYVKKSGGKYYIYKNVLDKTITDSDQMNYYVVNERYIADHKKEFPCFWNDNSLCQYKLEYGFKKVEEIKSIRGEDTTIIRYEGKSNPDYKVGFTKIAYKLSENNRISSVKIVDATEDYKNGWLVNSGFMNYKKVHYIIPDIDSEDEGIQIPPKDVEAFLIDLENRKNSIKRYKNIAYFSLPNEGEIKPVFYIYDNDHLYFGFTPRLRVFYNHTIKHGLKQDKTPFDYVKSLFGCIDDKDCYKSKVSFSDAIISNNVQEVVKDKVILGGPSPKSYLDYLVQPAGQSKSYNDTDFKLRGVKQYWLRNETISSSTGNGNENVMSSINALSADTEFSGKIRFQNLTNDELGLLLWSLKLNENSMQNIGMAKPYGYGCFKINRVNISIMDNKTAYSTSFSEWKQKPYSEKNADDFIKAYIEKANSALNSNIIEQPRIKDFFAMKSGFPDKTKIRYMQLKEYQSRKRDKVALPAVETVLGGKQ